MEGWNIFKVTRGPGIGRFVIEAEPQGGWLDVEDEREFASTLAAAPKLLAALECASVHLNLWPSYTDDVRSKVIAEVRAAIAAAKGACA